MPKLVPRTAPEPQHADPLRQALAAAIVNAREARDRSLASHAAARRAQENLDAAQARLSAAHEAVDAARQRQALVLINAAQDDRVAPSDKTLRAARAEAEICSDDLAAARQAFERLMDATVDLDHALQIADREVSERADEILVARAAEILADGEDLVRRLCNKTLVLQFLHEILARVSAANRRRVVAAAEDTSQAISLLNAAPEDAVGKAIEKFIALNNSTADMTAWRDHPALVEWRRALETLQHDAEAALP